MVELAMPDEAIASYRIALGIKPSSTSTLLNLGTALMNTGRNDSAIDCFQKILILHPDHAEAVFSLGIASNNKNRFKESLDYYTKALAIKPLYPEALNNMGNVFLKMKMINEAVDVFIKALKIKPDYFEAHNNLGNALKEQNLAEKAIASYRQAISINPNFSEAHCNIGVLYKELGDLDKAMTCFNKALEIKPDYAEANYNLGLAFLLKGDLKRGWKGYASRWDCHLLEKKRRSYEVPLWKDQVIKGKTLYLYPEQGLGDFIQFVRFLPLIENYGGCVIAEAPKILYELISNSFQKFQITCPGDKIGNFDYHAPLLDLPNVLEIDNNSIPAPNAYLFAPKELTQKWCKRLEAYYGLRVGLVWAGDPKHKNDKNRSIDPSFLAPLLKLEDINFFSLQLGHDGEANKVLGKTIVDLAPELTSFNETAAAMKNLDVIISIDSSPAHLAGALGCRVWTLLPFMPCWRWMLDGNTTPWYPSMRLFRQATIGDWSYVVKNLCQALRATRSSD